MACVALLPCACCRAPLSAPAMTRAVQPVLLLPTLLHAAVLVHPLQHLAQAPLRAFEESVDATVAVLAAAFAALAARIRGTLEGCCLQWEGRLIRSAAACVCLPWRQLRQHEAAPAAKGATEGGSLPSKAGVLGPGPVVEAAAAQLQQLADSYEAVRSMMTRGESDQSQVVLGACLVLLQQAEAVEAVLAALPPTSYETAQLAS